MVLLCPLLREIACKRMLRRIALSGTDQICEEQIRSRSRMRGQSNTWRGSKARFVLKRARNDLAMFLRDGGNSNSRLFHGACALACHSKEKAREGCVKIYLFIESIQPRKGEWCYKSRRLIYEGTHARTGRNIYSFPRALLSRAALLSINVHRLTEDKILFTSSSHLRADSLISEFLIRMKAPSRQFHAE